MKWSSLLSIFTYYLISTDRTVDAAKRPNVIALMFDDLGKGSIFQDHPTHTDLVDEVTLDPDRVITTPGLNRLSNYGMRFNRAYAPAPVCTPSRAAYAAGRPTNQFKVRDNINPKAIEIEDQTVAELFKSHGYTTIKFGKNALGSRGTSTYPYNRGFDQFIGHEDNVAAHYVFPRQMIWYNDTIKTFSKNRQTSTRKCERQRKCDYDADIVRDEVVAGIHAHNKIAPFYFEVTPTQPHLGAYPGKKNGFHNLVPDLGQYAIKKWKSDLKGYAAMVSYYIDNLSLEIYSALEKEGIEKDSLLLIFSDQGAEYVPAGKSRRQSRTRLEPVFLQANGGREGYKRYVLEGGVQIPFLAIWTGHIAPGTDTDFPINLYDLKRTFMHLLNSYSDDPKPSTDFTSTIDGPVSILPVLLGDSSEVKREYMSVELCLNNKERNCKWAIYKTNDADSLMKLVYDVPNQKVPYSNVRAGPSHLFSKRFVIYFAQVVVSATKPSVKILNK